MSIRTLLVTKEYPPFKGGVANYYYNLASHFPNHETFLVLDNNNSKLDSGQGFFSWRPAFKEIYRKIRKAKINRVLVGHILPLGTVVYFLSFILPFKYFVFLHGLDLSSALKTKRKKKISILILKRAEKIIAANSFVAASLLKEFPAFNGKVVVINPGLAKNYPLVSDEEKEVLRAEYDLSDKKILFSLGRLVKRKGFDYTIEALKKMNAQDLENLIYIIAGGGPEAENLKRAVPDNLKDKVLFLDEINEGLKWRWLAICDIFIMPARNIDCDYEVFGIVYLEANLFSKPVIAGRAGGVVDAVVNGLNGLLVDPENIDDIKEAILKLKNEPELAIKLGIAGQERVKANFNWEKLAFDLYKIIK